VGVAFLEKVGKMKRSEVDIDKRKKLKLDTEINMPHAAGRWKISSKIPVVVVEDHCEVKVSFI